ncbi:MAG: glycosyltransferase [Chitinophagales bacterium]
MQRTLMVTPFFKSQRGNSITATRLYNGLRGKGYTIDLVSMDEPDWQLQLNRYTQSNSYSLVHGFHALQFSRALNHPALKNLPILLTTTGTDINYDLSGPQKEETLQTILKARRIVVFNPDLHRRLTDLNPGLQSRLMVIPQGVDLPAAPEITRRQIGLSDAETVFIIPSGLRPVKNLDLALDGLDMAHRSNPQLSLLILGAAIDIEYTDHINSRISQLDWAHYLGEIPHQKIGGIIYTADIVLNTSWSEGQPQGALEAMYLGKPCILTAVPGNLDIIENGVQGFYINSAAELADAASQLIQNPSLRNNMGNAARQLVNNKYSAERELNAYDQLYKALLENQPTSQTYREIQSQI